MKHTIKLISLVLIVFGLANCGSKGGGTPPTSNAAENADQIQIINGGDTVTWSQSRNNIFIPAANGCVKGLANQSFDESVNQKFEELSQLINTSIVAKGVQAEKSQSSIYLTIRYKDGLTRTFNLNNELASTTEETLSNGAQIIDFFDNVEAEIQQSGKVSCNNGKK